MRTSRYCHFNGAKRCEIAFLDNQAGESPAYLAAKNLCERFFHTILDTEDYDNYSISFSGKFGMTVFHVARILNDDIMLSLIKRRKELLTHQDNKVKTVLHYVVEDNIEPMVKILLKVDSSLACLHDNDGMTPLHIATSMGSFPMVRTILELSPQSILLVCEEDDYKGKTPLHVAKMDVGFLRVCLRHTRMNELINVTDHQGDTPLHLALKNSCDLDIANALLEADDIDWWLNNKDGSTPVDLCKSNHNILCSKLVSKSEVDGVSSDGKISSKLKNLTWEYGKVKHGVNIRRFHGSFKSLDELSDSRNGTNWEEVFTSYRGVEEESIVHVAARQGHMGIIKKAAHECDCKSRIMVLSGENLRGETPLHVAVAAGELEVVEVILKLSISTDKLGNKKDEQQQLGVVVEPIHPTNHDQDHHNNAFSVNSHSEWKPWRSKSTNGDTPLHAALKNGHEKLAMRLLKWDPGLIFSLVNKANESLLYLAAHGGYDAVIQHMLSDNSQPISASGPHGQNALHAIVTFPQGKEGTAYNLMSKMPQLLINVDSDGKTPLHYMAELGGDFRLLYVMDEEKVTTAALLYDNEGFTPLLRAAANGFYNCAFHIIRCCSYSVQLRHAHNERTILHLLRVMDVNALNKWMDIMKYNPTMASLINQTDTEGNIPLHCAILESDIYKTRLLLSIKGIRLSIQNKQHDTPMDLCIQLRENGDSEQLAILIALEDGIAREEERTSRVHLLERIITRVVVASYSGHGKSSDEDLKKVLESVAVASALLITLSFAATFTIPGGYDQNTGQALRTKETSVKVFIASNVVAMLLGVGLLLAYAFGATEKTLLRVVYIPCVVTLQCALLATIISFISGVYALVSQDAMWIVILAIVIISGVLLFLNTPAVADDVTRILTWLRKCLKWLIIAGKEASS